MLVVSNGKLKESVKSALSELIDLTDQHFVETPRRVESWLREFTTYVDPKAVLDEYCKTFISTSTDTVVVHVPSVYMLCPHHFLPIEMDITVSYVPNGKILGLSKFTRIAERLAKYPRPQEDYTTVLRSVYERCLDTSVKLKIRGRHMCVEMRGAKKNSIVVTGDV